MHLIQHPRADFLAQVKASENRNQRHVTPLPPELPPDSVARDKRSAESTRPSAAALTAQHLDHGPESGSSLSGLCGFCSYAPIGHGNR